MKRKASLFWSAVLTAGATLWLHTPALADVKGALDAISQIGREGAGNEKAQLAWKEIIQAGPGELLPVLHAMGRGGPIVDNWLRDVAYTLADQGLRSKSPLPLRDVEQFLQEKTNSPAGRQMAFDILQQADPPHASSIVASLLDDPVQELRRPAVQALLDSAKTATGDQVTAIYRDALQHVRDEDQTRLIARELKERGVPVDLPKHFGFLMTWNVIGPFENDKNQGFFAVYPPEEEINLAAEYSNAAGTKLKWLPLTSTDEYGKIDLNKPFGLLKEVTGYAVTTINIPEAREAELRLGCKNGWKVWLNGELLFGRDEYHRGQQMDQYKLPCHLKKGVNTVLVKCCQDAQKEMWTVEWEFQLRLCDSSGTAITPLEAVQNSR